MPARSVRPFSLSLSALLLALLFAVLLGPAVAQAGTVTIVDGTAAPSGGIYTDGWIQDHLNITGSLTISTTGIVSGPDDILVQAGVGNHLDHRLQPHPAGRERHRRHRHHPA